MTNYANFHRLNRLIPNLTDSYSRRCGPYTVTVIIKLGVTLENLLSPPNNLTFKINN